MKRNILAGILISVSVLLCGCGAGSNEGAVSLEPQPLKTEDASGSTAPGEEATAASESKENGIAVSAVDNVPESTDAETGVQSSASADSPDTYVSIYLQEIEENEGNTKGYSLIYLDEDDIPELLILDREYDSYTIYTMNDGALFCMVDSMTTVEMTYYEKSGIIAAFSRWNGGGDEGGYGQNYDQVSREQTLTDETQPLLSFSYNAVYNAEGVYTGEGVTNYYYMGQEIDEQAYQEKLNSLGIVEDRKRVCTENICSREEMIGLLNQ